MSKNLVIVESPAKAKTIEKYLGKDYKVLSSMGHIRDLPESGGLGIDIKNNFKPEYKISDDKIKIVASLKKAAKGKTVWLATDEDREGEAISWHLCFALGLDPKTTKRITFHEITKTAIENSIKAPRKVDLNLVNAQQARRILDRLVGYELSPVLWKKIQTGLSAGRVQSVTVRLVVEREREIENFEKKADFKIIGSFKSKSGEELKAELEKHLPGKKDSEALFAKIVGSVFTISAITKKPSKKSPPPPFTTSTLQQAAASRLGFSVRQTMVLAQKLYESGHITYMRTDSVNLSETALNQASKQIVAQFGQKYHKKRQYRTKSAGAQQAHEAIRPTDFATTAAGRDPKQQKLYRLILARALASQMSDAEVEKTEIFIDNDKVKEKFIAKGEIIVFPGFLKAYGSAKQADDSILADVTEGDVVKYEQITASETYARPPARYSEASLVKKLESEGIGRPSTYAPTISTVQARGYVQKSDGIAKTRKILIIELQGDKLSSKQESENYDTDRNRLMPTDTGVVVTDFLLKFFKEIVDYQFTAKVEKEFDDIADGNEKWQEMIADFYKPFHKLVEASEKISRGEATQSSKLGTDPKSKKPVIARLGRYGAMIQIGEAEDEEKPKFAPMPEGRKIADVTLEEALKMFELPRIVGKTVTGDEITAQIGRFGPYLKAGALNVSMGQLDPFSITEKQANELIRAHQKKLAERVIANFEKEGIQVLNGRFGPYVTDGKQNAKIPKESDPKKLSLKDCQKILQQKQSKK